ncbi:MAG: hypothetical protein QOF76_3978 [Solirubrobacteraceae bacterium]|jgi:diguanylate cyclase (GGDEF)-like protein/PAS domain S-box-containing protein|nr:hypothetical protein [Solirubrobacteraceae bacterium]
MPRVLLVDDDSDDLFLTTALLKQIASTRYEVHTAATVAEVQTRLDDSVYDVFLVDFRLGPVDGLRVAESILARDRHAPVILLTGMDDREVDLRAAEIGVADFLLKRGLDANSLDRAIRYAISHQRALRALAESEERYARAVAGADAGLWDWDLRGDRIVFSDRFKTMLGYPPDEPVASPAEWFAKVHPDDQTGMQQLINAHLNGLTEQFEAEYRILCGDGDFRWMLSRGRAERGPAGAALRLAGSQTDITERKQAEQRLQHQALHDALTGLPNRALFQDRLEHTIRRERRRASAAAVLFIDLDNFKVVNDSLGHALGDRLLVEVAERLEATIRPGDTVARLGGDEFILLLEDLPDYLEAQRVAGRVLEELRAPFGERGLYVSASIGIAMVMPGTTAAEVIRDADAAMYRAKAEGRGRHALFDTTLHEAAVARLDVETRLRRGLGVDEIGGPGLRVVYQAIANAGDVRLRGFEALARWEDADGTLMMPDAFIPVAEETGMIATLGRLVLREACRQLAEWQQRPGGQGLFVSVNISGRQLLEPGFVAEVEAALDDAGILPAALRLEVTETTASTDTEAVRLALERMFRLTGVQAYLDDFGVGTASLTALREFPGDALKIDRSFVLAMSTDPGAFHIVKAVVALAHELGMAVVAEGVESQSQLDLLRSLDCEYCQGYLLARPLSPAAAGTLLEEGLSQLLA